MIFLFYLNGKYLIFYLIFINKKTDRTNCSIRLLVYATSYLNDKLLTSLNAIFKYNIWFAVAWSRSMN